MTNQEIKGGGSGKPLSQESDNHVNSLGEKKKKRNLGGPSLPPPPPPLATVISWGAESSECPLLCPSGGT